MKNEFKHLDPRYYLFFLIKFSFDHLLGTVRHIVSDKLADDPPLMIKWLMQSDGVHRELVLTHYYMDRELLNKFEKTIIQVGEEAEGNIGKILFWKLFTDAYYKPIHDIDPINTSIV